MLGLCICLYCILIFLQIRVGTIKHDLTVGMKCEALHPKNRIEICPATVVKIFDEFYFLVVIDDLTLDDDGLLSSDLFWLGYIGHPCIFPIGNVFDLNSPEVFVFVA